MGHWPVSAPLSHVAAREVVGGPATVARRYHLSSLPNAATRFAKAVRGHWAIENQLHRVLDVVSGEDQSRARAGRAASPSTSAARSGPPTAAPTAVASNPPVTQTTSASSSAFDASPLGLRVRWKVAVRYRGSAEWQLLCGKDGFGKQEDRNGAGKAPAFWLSTEQAALCRIVDWPSAATTRG